MEVLYTQCLRYNICSTWFLNITISTCDYLVATVYGTVLETDLRGNWFEMAVLGCMSLVLVNNQVVIYQATHNWYDHVVTS